jgi:hypothetical protein
MGGQGSPLPGEPVQPRPQTVAGGPGGTPNRGRPSGPAAPPPPTRSEGKAAGKPTTLVWASRAAAPLGAATSHRRAPQPCTSGPGGAEIASGRTPNLVSGRAQPPLNQVLKYTNIHIHMPN